MLDGPYYEVLSWRQDEMDRVLAGDQAAIRIEALNSVNRKPSEREVLYVMPGALGFSDYTGGPNERANVQAFEEGNEATRGALWVPYIGSYGARGILLRADADERDEAIAEIVAALESYPALDETLSVQIEQELIEAAWDSRDFLHDLQDIFVASKDDEIYDEIESRHEVDRKGGALFQDLYWTLAEITNTYPHVEEGGSVAFQFQRALVPIKTITKLADPDLRARIVRAIFDLGPQPNQPSDDGAALLHALYSARDPQRSAVLNDKLEELGVWEHQLAYLIGSGKKGKFEGAALGATEKRSSQNYRDISFDVEVEYKTYYAPVAREPGRLEFTMYDFDPEDSEKLGRDAVVNLHVKTEYGLQFSPKNREMVSKLDRLTLRDVPDILRGGVIMFRDDSKDADVTVVIKPASRAEQIAQEFEVWADELEATGFAGYTPKSIDPATMAGAAINKELDRLDEESSKLADEFIAEGRGHETGSETLTKDDPLALRYRAIFNRRMDLRNEVEQRAGPGMRRLPKGFGRPRR